MACSSVQAQQGDEKPAQTEEPKTGADGTDGTKAPEANSPSTPPTQAEASNDTKEAKASPDPAVLEKIGAAALDIIAAADRVELVEVANSKNPDAAKHLQSHEIKSEPIALGAEDIATLRTAILTKKTHMLKARARCRFRPEYGLIFHQGEKTTSVLFAPPRCPKWSFEATPKRKIIDIRKPAGTSLAELITKIKGGASK